MGSKNHRIHQVRNVFIVIASVILLSANNVDGKKDIAPKSQGAEYAAINCRAHSASLTEFGGVGDGKTLNTKAFQDAIKHLSQFESQGGSELIVPPGKWLTSSFNLTSHFTLFLHKDAVLLASEVETDWEVIAPLPSYGVGRDTTEGRYISLIFGTNLTDVVITGENGTIDGQGRIWWDKFKKNEIKHTRPYLIEIMFSTDIQISNITLVNSPNWNVHPIYSSNIIIQGITILSDLHSKNTDGINPDSCSNIRIEDCYIESGDDCVAVKSGWDQYGIAFGMPTKQLVVRRLTCISPTSAMIALGSEMSGGIEDVRVEDITAINTESAVRIKTAPGRGAYVKDIYVRGMTLNTMNWVFWITGNYGQHPDNKTDLNAIPVVENINYQNVVAKNVTIAARLDGIPGHQFKGICISNVSIEMAPSATPPIWNCTDEVAGMTTSVTPPPCPQLAAQGPPACKFVTDKLPIENVKLKMCPVPTGGTAPGAQPPTPSASAPTAFRGVASTLPGGKAPSAAPEAPSVASVENSPLPAPGLNAPLAAP
ncbi:hypothetical protein ACET3Z_008454 [Daucus carota]